MDAQVALQAAGLVTSLLGAVGVAYLTSRASAKAATKSAEVAAQTAATSSLAELEKEAGKRTHEYWKGVVDDQRREHEQDRAEIAALRAEQARDRALIADQQRQIDTLTREVHECRALCRRLERPDPTGPTDFTD